MFDRKYFDELIKPFERSLEQFGQTIDRSLDGMLEREYKMLVQYFRDLGYHEIASYLENKKKILKPLLVVLLMAIQTLGSVAEAIASFPEAIWWLIVEHFLNKEIEWIRANPGKATLKLTAAGLHLVTGGNHSILLLLAKQGATRIPAYLLNSEKVKDRLNAVYNAADIIKIVKDLVVLQA